MKDRSDKFTVDPASLNVFSSMEEAEKFIKEHSTVVVTDNDSNKSVQPPPALSPEKGK
jgi:hypothetical protein